jgi:hypothetical protein
VVQEILADAVERLGGSSVIENSANVVGFEEFKDTAAGEMLLRCRADLEQIFPWGLLEVLQEALYSGAWCCCVVYWCLLLLWLLGLLCLMLCLLLFCHNLSSAPRH